VWISIAAVHDIDAGTWAAAIDYYIVSHHSDGDTEAMFSFVDQNGDFVLDGGMAADQESAQALPAVICEELLEHAVLPDIEICVEAGAYSWDEPDYTVRKDTAC
jgi:hypothetical protein